MPNITRVIELPWPLSGNQVLGWYSRTRRAFVVGNHADKTLVPVQPGARPTVLVKRADPYAQKTHACDDQLDPADYDDLARSGRDGFQFLPRERYDSAFAGRKYGSCCPVDQAVSSGLAQQLPVLHAASGAIVSFADKRITLHADTPGLEKIGEIKTRGVMTEAMLAAPRSDHVYYADSTGDFVQVPVSRTSIGPAKKLFRFENIITTIRAAEDGPHLFVGGGGLVAAVAPVDDRVVFLARKQVACRSISVLNDQWLLVNQGMHGFTLFDVSRGELRADLTQKPPAAIDQLIASPGGQHVLAITKMPVSLAVYTIYLGD
jgi:hypothetical protein